MIIIILRLFSAIRSVPRDKRKAASGSNTGIRVPIVKGSMHVSTSFILAGKNAAVVVINYKFFANVYYHIYLIKRRLHMRAKSLKSAALE